MASKKSNVTRLKPQPQTQLTDDEVKRISEKIAVALEHRTEETALLILLFRHIEALAESKDSYIDLWSCLFTVRQHLFVGCAAFERAQDQFHAKSYLNRGRLLRWPHERNKK